MVARTSLWLFVVTALFVLASMPAGAQRSRYDPAAGRESKPREGFLDLALKQINPGDKDYGECIAEGRRLLVEQTIENSLFWSNVMAIGMLILSVGTVFYQSKEWKRRELIAATCLAQYHNLLVRARRAAYEATSHYNALIEERNAVAERELREPTPRRQSVVKQGSAKLSAHELPVTPHAASAPKSDSTPPVPAHVGGHDGGLVAKVNALQHQLSAALEQARVSQEREQIWRQRLNQYERAPDADPNSKSGQESRKKHPE